MKFLCVSDQIDPLVYSNTVKERYSDIDAVFCAGDLSMEYVDFIVTTLGKPTYFVFGNHNLNDFYLYDKRATMGHVQQNEIDRQSKAHGGDYASNKVLTSRHLTFSLPNGRTTPLIICGVSGSIRYNNGQAQYTDAQMKWQLIEMIPKLLWNKIKYGRYCDVFLTHASPRHIHDREDPCHKGFECFNWFIQKFKPSLMIHGHIHLYDMNAPRTTVSGDTTIVNAFSHIVIEMEPASSSADNNSDNSNGYNNKNENTRTGDNLGFNISVLTDR